MKRGKQINIRINFSDRWLYTLIIFGILIVAGIGVYAYGTGSPTTSGHTGNEIAVDSTLCSAVTGHNCGYDIDTDTDTRGVSSCTASLTGCSGHIATGGSWGYYGCPAGMVANQFYVKNGYLGYVWCCSISISCA
jgi:hypothetical protein